MFLRVYADKDFVKSFPPIQRRTTALSAGVLDQRQVHPSLSLPDPAWLMWLEEVREFIRTPDLNFKDLAQIELVYINYCRRWHASASEHRWNPNTLINSLGVVLGDLVRSQVPSAQWRVTVEGRSSSAVLATPSGEILTSPILDVADRWLAGEQLWMGDYVSHIARLTEPRGLAAPSLKTLFGLSA